ncbi:ribosome silencing factor [Corynebacterium bovis]|uniref:Ribosomal silencing factor RsfS n=1 Tax=Corynebacterium bovis TaxID=36808 RepID=A0A3R8QPW4_9CORY|nr:ribosome silencing factor [Corynebacterium bovis]RRO90482.1 ribosome silencing factor [Corynebacterium bovis]RRO94057.1 ribosome silencing factor [Corynebacterium bovis]RRO94280.1 ribosome silencing factor [Corynebacterium bovis]RRO98928.1 ribosome silencing factor [Corynebacterium bovis]RRO99557.1 ribosome silencing factor [Corynebacterium bovis]
MTASTEAITRAGIAARAADEKLGEDILVLDVSDRLAITEVFLLCSGDNERQVDSIVDEIEAELSEKEGVKPNRREGHRDGRWVLLDYGELIVHVQRRDEREYYALDRLYRDCPQIEVEGVEQADRGAWASDVEVDSVDAASVEDLPLAGPAPDADSF